MTKQSNSFPEKFNLLKINRKKKNKDASGDYSRA